MPPRPPAASIPVALLSIIMGFGALLPALGSTRGLDGQDVDTVGVAAELAVAIRGDVKVHRYTVAEGAEGLTAAPAETVSRGLAVSSCHEDPNSVYCNTLGTALWGPREANQRIADDIVLAGDAGCDLDRYVIRVTGDKGQDGTGTALGAYTVTAGLYEVCPTSSPKTPTPIPGTELTFSVPVEQAGDIVEITKQISRLQSVPLPAQLYLAVTFSREKCGVVVGAPALKGFSDDRMDIPLAPCNGWLGGFPRFPHASIYAEIYTRGTCDSTFLGFRNSAQHGQPYSCGLGCRFADDIQLSVPGGECNLVAYEVAYRGAIVGLDLREVLIDSDPAGGTTAIPGTTGACFPLTPDQNEICRVEVDPPVRLNLANLWMTFRSSSATLGPLRACRDAQVGETADLYRVYDPVNRRWVDVVGDKGICWGGFDVTLYCEGPPTVGACCDMYVMECLGGDNDGAACTDNNQCPGGRCEAACRDVPEQNCTSSLLGHRRLWERDTRCGAQCNGGVNDGLRCGGDDDCSICVGGVLDGQTCCPGGTCAAGTCVGGSRDGFVCCPAFPPDPPGQCSVATCEGPVCQGGTNNGESCTRAADCPEGKCTGGPFSRSCGLSACCLQDDDPEFPCRNLTQNECFDRAGGPAERFEIGQFCGAGSQRCPIDRCLLAEGDCCTGRPGPVCVAGPNQGQMCDPGIDDCLGVCRDIDDGEMHGECMLSCPSGQVCARQVCRGGTNDGQPCNVTIRQVTCPGGACGGSLCPGSPGCESPLCCTDVCESLGDFYCCAVHWDEMCAEQARDVCDYCRLYNACSTVRWIPIPLVTREVPTYLCLESDEPGLCCYEEDPGRAPTGGAMWFRFTAPPAPEGETTSSVRLSTCDSRIEDRGSTRYVAADSLLAVFATKDPDQGVCANGTICSIETQDCEDGSACVLDNRLGFERLTQIGCNDDDPTCVDNGTRFPRRSSLCVTDLVPGDPYWVVVAGKDAEPIKLPRACSITETPCSTDALCEQELEGQTCELTNYCSESFTSCLSALDCFPGEACLNNPGISTLILNTGIFQLTATEGCTPERPRMVNDRCEDALPIEQTGFCSINATDCLFDSECPQADQGETCEPISVEFDLSGDVVGVCEGGSRDGLPCLLRFSGQCPQGQCRPQAPATFDCPGPPSQCVQHMQNEVWYQWIAPVDGNVEMDTCARVCLDGQNRGRTCTTDAECLGGENSCGNPDTGLVVYEGCECNAGIDRIRACSEFVTELTCLGGSRVSLDVAAAQCYLLRLSGNEGDLTNGRLRLQERVCGMGDVTFISPPDGVVDARQTHPPWTPFITQGIARFVVKGPPGAEVDLDPRSFRADPLCWAVSFTGEEERPMRSIEKNGDGTVVLRFVGPFGPGTIELTYTDYLGNATTGTLYVRPGDVDADAQVTPADVAALFDCCLLDACGWTLGDEPFRCDIDHSETVAPADLLREIDIVSGAESYQGVGPP